jgi:hypothetical protein
VRRAGEDLWPTSGRIHNSFAQGKQLSRAAVFPAKSQGKDKEAIPEMELAPKLGWDLRRLRFLFAKELQKF